MDQIDINGARYSRAWLDDNYAAGQEILARAKTTDTRPRCLCRPGGVEMYIAKHSRYHVNRMPGTGSQHQPACPSFDLEEEAIEAGGCVQIRSDGTVKVSLGFMLATAPEGPAEKPEAKAGDGPDEPGTPDEAAMPGEKEVTAEEVPPAEEPVPAAAQEKLSLLGLLRLLWRLAGFNRWSPGMAGKRKWHVIRYYLSREAERLTTGRAAIGDHIFIPPIFDSAKPEEGGAALLARVNAHAKGKRTPLTFVIGEAKEIFPTKKGFGLRIRHLPKAAFWLSEDKAQKAFPDGLPSPADGPPLWRMICIASIKPAGDNAYAVHEIACMRVSREWIPCKPGAEDALCAQLVSDQRSFIRPLWVYPDDGTATSYALTDTGQDVTRVFCEDVEGAAQGAMQRMSAAGKRACLWSGTGEPPRGPLPRRQEYADVGKH